MIFHSWSTSVEIHDAQHVILDQAQAERSVLVPPHVGELPAGAGRDQVVDRRTAQNDLLAALRNIRRTSSRPESVQADPGRVAGSHVDRDASAVTTYVHRVGDTPSNVPE